MHIRPIARFIVLCSLLGFARAADVPVAEKVATTISLISDQTVDVGTIPAYGVKQIPFRFKNAGKVPVHFRKLIPTCSCVKGSVEKTTLEPNEEIDVMFNLDASMVHDSFKRTLWVETDASDNPRLQLAVTGVIRPLFVGMPRIPITLVSTGPDMAWTNRYTLTATEGDMLLGAPQIVTNDMLNMSLNLTTNRTEGKAEYTLTLIAQPQGRGRCGGSALVPVLSREGRKLHALTFLVHGNAGAELHVAPQRILLVKSEQPLSRKLRFRTSGGNASPDKLTWEPKIEGVTVSVDPANAAFKSSFGVTVQISPEAATRLAKEEDTAITFTYPDHNPTTVKLTPYSPRTAN